MRSQKLTHPERAYCEEELAKNPEAVSFGTGLDLQEQTGLNQYELAEIFAQSFHMFVDGGGNAMELSNGDRKVFVYIRRHRDRWVEIGTRKDFHGMGWEKACDVLDRQLDPS
jgi:hypothetical protein